MDKNTKQEEAASEMDEQQVASQIPVESGDDIVETVSGSEAIPSDVEPVTDDIAKADELMANGRRLLVLKKFLEAAEMLSEACDIYAMAWGELDDRIAMPLLLYAQSIVEQHRYVYNELGDHIEEETDEARLSSTDIAAAIVEAVVQNVVGGGDNEEPENVADEAAEDITEESVDEEKYEQEENNEGQMETLQVAWESLEVSKQIFNRNETDNLLPLSKCHFWLAEISYLNAAHKEALDDYELAIRYQKKAEETTTDIEKEYKRESEIRYQKGLCYIATEQFDEAIESLLLSKQILSADIENLEKEAESDGMQDTIESMRMTLEMVDEKIKEVQDTMAEARKDIRTVFERLVDAASTSAGASSAVATSDEAAAAPAPNNVSHLVKRKKPENQTAEEQPPKKQRTMEKDDDSE